MRQFLVIWENKEGGQYWIFQSEETVSTTDVLIALPDINFELWRECEFLEIEEIFPKDVITV